MAVHEVLSGRPDWKTLQGRLDNLAKAEAAYMADPEKARNLMEVGWTEERRAAARRGEAIMVDSEATAGPVLGLTAFIQQQAGPSIPLSPWSEFANLRNELAEETRILKLRYFPEIREAAKARERELLDQVMRTPPGEADSLLSELRDLLEVHRDCAGLAQMRDNLRLPRPDRVDLVAMVQAALRGRSLLDPLPEEEAEVPRVILRRPAPGGAPAVQIPNHRMRGPQDPALSGAVPGPIRRGPRDPGRPIMRRTEVPGHRLENPPGDQPRVPPPPAEVP